MTHDVQPGRYRHFKGGAYVVLCIARDVDTEKLVVVYTTAVDILSALKDRDSSSSAFRR
jgi:hypothetical protein